MSNPPANGDWIGQHNGHQSPNSSGKTGIDNTGSGRSPEAEKRILRERAAALAQPPQADSGKTTDLEFVVFLLNEEEYGLESIYVKEIVPVRELTPLPTTPAFVAGIINVRGQILAVLDLRALFGLSRELVFERQSVLVLHSLSQQFGVLTHGLLGIQRLDRDKLQGALPDLSGYRQDYFKGITPSRVVLLDGAKILGDDRLLVHQEIQA